MALPRLIDVQEFFADPAFSGATISPDGTKIAYLAPARGRTNVWVRALDEEHADAVCVTHDTRRGIKTYYWTDDPRWLLYRQDTDGNEDWHLYRVDLEAPELPAVDLTPVDPGSRALYAGPIKSVPGSILVSMNRRPMLFDLFRIDIATGETTLHRETTDQLGHYLGHEGEARFYATQAEDGTHEYYAVDSETGDKRLIFAAGGPEFPVGLYPSLPTPDGNGLVLGAYQEGDDDLRLIRLEHATGEQRVIAARPGHNLCIMGIFTEDFGLPPSLFFSQRTGELIAARFVGDRPTVEPLDPHFAEVYAALSKLSDGELESASSDESEQRWVASFIHDREPGLTYFYDHTTGESRLLFRAYPNLDPADLAPMTAVSFTARDGLPLHAFLTLPVGVEPNGLPMVLRVHGGPWAHDSWGYNREVQFLANRGYAVLQVNFRGSSGYGKRHITAAIKQLAGTMHDDLIDAADWAVKQGYADRSRIGIYGGSYGGYATLVGVTVTPDYFAAAVDYVGISSLVNFMGGLPAFVKPLMQNNWLLYAGDPDDPEQHADMLARSPITMVDRIRTPLLVLQGANDVRVVRSESDAMVESLRARGVPVEYFVADDEGHDFKNPENLITMYGLIERHFGEHLGAVVASPDPVLSTHDERSPMALPPLLDIETLFADPVFAGATISPDGTRIAYLAPAHGRLQVWVRGIDEEHADALCVTHDARRGVHRYQWTDDPRWLLYQQDTDGNEDWHLYRVDLDAPDEPAVDITPLAPGSRVTGAASVKWKPGSVLVTMNQRPAFFDTFLIELATGETTLYRECEDPASGFFFGPNGEAFSMSLAEDGTWEFYAIDDATGEKRLVRGQGGAEHPVGPYPVAVTPDGTGLLIAGYGDTDDLHLVRVDVETGKETVVAAMPGHSLCTMGGVAPGLPPALLTKRGTDEVLAVRFVGDRPSHQILDPEFAEVYAALSKLSDGVLASATSDESGKLWVASFTHDREPGLTYLYDHSTGESRLLFRPYPDLDPAVMAPMTPISLTARDGLPLHGFLTLPVGVEPTGLPLVLKVHGGPWCHDSWCYDPHVQFFANRGYAVLQLNFRGSSGYGKHHITAAIHELAGKMHDDLIDAADWAVKQGYADPSRIGIYGGSYGGYATLVAVTFTPDYFAAAVDYVGISDLANFMRTLPPFTRPYQINNWYLYVGDPEDPAQLPDIMARSPITKVDDIRTPLLVVQGANDPRVVQAESDNIVAALRERGVPVEYMVKDDEGHGFVNPENVIDMFRAIERHFGQYLGGRTAISE